MLPRRTMACSLPNRSCARVRTSSSMEDVCAAVYVSSVLFASALPSRKAASGDIALTVGISESVQRWRRISSCSRVKMAGSSAFRCWSISSFFMVGLSS